MLACLIPAPFDLCDLEGVLTGMWMLACVSLLRTNRKAGTKPLMSMGLIRPI